MAEEAQIVNRIVVQGIDEAKAQVRSLRQLLNEAKAGYEQARRSANEQGLFQGATQGADELKRVINEIQLQIKRLNTEISQGDFSTREKNLNEELSIRQRLAKLAEQQAAKELADQQRLIEQMASGRERAMTQAANRESQINTAQVARMNSAAEQEKKQMQSLAEQIANYRETSAVRTAAREEQMNSAQVARMNSAAEQEMTTRQQALDYESNVRRQLAKLAEQQAVVDSIGTVGSQASYAKQMSTLSTNIEESYRAFQRGAIGSTEYTAALDKYTKGMSVAKAEQEAFSKSIGTYTSAWDSMRKRVESHASWIMAGGAIATALAIPAETISQLKEADTLLAKIKQNLELAPRYQGNTAGLEEDVKNIENVAGVFSMAYGQNLKDTMEMMQILSRRFKSPEEITYFTNLALTMAKLDFVKPQKAAEDLEATILSMGLNFEQSKRFIDEFSVAVHVARINGTDLLTGLQRSAATFHNMNFNTAEAIAMISTLSTVTAKAGANIGASLNSILINVDFKKAAEALQAYGIQVYNTSGQMRDGVEIWREIATVFNGLDTQHANEFANAMSGGRQTCPSTWKHVA